MTTETTQHRSILVLFAHPAINRSEINRPLYTAAQHIQGVTCVDLYAEYPNFDIDIEREQERLRRHDVIIFLHPFYWYSTPSLLKEWQDLVLEYGVAYGEEGTLLHGKLCFNALTAGAPESSYHHGEMNNFTLKELLSPLAQMAQFCGMIYLPPFALFTAREATEEGRLGGHIADWVKTLEALRDNRFNIEKASQQTYLNSDPDSLFEDPQPVSDSSATS